MHKPSSLFLPLALLSAAALAQTTPPAASDAWQAPAASASVAAHAAPALPGGASGNTATPFKFKSERKTWTKEPPPPRANDKAAVMGTERAWQNGRAPVSCAQTPRDPACR